MIYVTDACMKQLNVKIDKSSYPIVITSDFGAFTKYADGEKNKCIIITDQNVAKYHLDTFYMSIKDSFQKVLTYVVEPGEKSKSLKVVEDIYFFLLEYQICRKDVIMTLV